MKRDHGLNIQYILNPAILTDWKVHIVLKRNADEVAHWILKCRKQLVIVRGPLALKQAYRCDRKGATIHRKPHLVSDDVEREQLQN